MTRQSVCCFPTDLCGKLYHACTKPLCIECCIANHSTVLHIRIEHSEDSITCWVPVLLHLVAMTYSSALSTNSGMQVLITPVLECLHSHAQDWYDEWSPEELQVDHFRGFQFEQVGSSLHTQPYSGFLEPEDVTGGPTQDGPVRPPKLVAIAAAVLWSKSDMQRAGDLMELSSHNQNLSDVLLSVNKLGYGVSVHVGSLERADSHSCALVLYLSDALILRFVL